MAMTKITVKTIKVAITMTFIEISIVLLLGNFPILFLTTHRVRFGLQLIPTPYVRNGVLKPCHYDFHAASDRFATLAARRGGTPRPFLRKQNLAGTSLPDGTT